MLVQYRRQSLNNVAYSLTLSHTALTSLSQISALLSLRRLQLEGKILKDWGLMTANSTFSQDEWAQDYVILISAYIKASAETESLTTPSVWFFYTFEPKPAVFTTRTNRSSTVNVTLQFKAARWQSQGNKNNYFSRLLSFINSSCTHLATGYGLLTHPLLFVLNPVQQRGSSRGRRSFRFQRRGLSDPTSCNTPFPVSCFMPPEEKGCSWCTASLKSPVILSHSVKMQPSGPVFSCAQWRLSFSL